MSPYYFVYSTFPDNESALSASRKLVESNLAACANVIPGMTSIYRWEGRTEESQETVLIAKTLADKYEPLESFLREIHPYTCPCIVALPIETGFEGYFEWIAQNLRTES